MDAGSAQGYFAVVPAAGIGSRMKSAIPKQYMKIAGRAVIEHSLERLLSHPRISLVVVSLADNDEFWPQLNISANSRVRTTIGGATRAESVLNGLSALSDIARPDDWVLVHDAARPCLSEPALNHLIDSLQRHAHGGLLAVPARDTLKQATSTDAEPLVAKTLQRDLVWQAQTPQMFRFKLLENALVRAMSSNTEITDEASAVEAAGDSVQLIQGEASNLKITTPEDLTIAEAILRLGN